MTRYLLFDSGCSVCTELAGTIERESNGWLSARSLRDPTMQDLLRRAQPQWRWEPTLLEVEGERVCAFSGFRLRTKLLRGIGIRRSWRIADLVSKVSATSSATSGARRTFLRRLAMSAGFAVFAPGVLPAITKAQSTKSPPIIWLSGQEEAKLVHEATQFADVQHLRSWLAQTQGRQLDQARACMIPVDDTKLYSVIFSSKNDVVTAAQPPTQIVYVARYQKTIARTAAQQYYHVSQGQVQAVAVDKLPPNQPLKELARQRSISNTNTRGRCCSLYLACFAADVVCAALFAACLGGCLPCCPVGLGSCGAGVAQCAAAAGCGRFDCFS